MTQNINFWEAIKRIRAKDGRFATELYPFLMEALDFTIRDVGERRHISARELLDGMCRYARDKFGLLAQTVLEKWGVHTPVDIGLAVYQLVEAGVLSKQKSDQLEDFDIDYDLRDVLEKDYFT